MMKDNSRAVFDYIKAHNNVDMTSDDVAEALGLPKRTVDGCFTSAIQRKNLGVRVPAEVELEDGTHKTVKYLHLNDAGLAFDPDAEADAE